MTLPVELETSVNQLRLKHAALIDAVNAYRSGTIDASKQDLLDLANDINKQLTVEEHTLLGQVARKGRMPSLLLDFANGKYAVGDRRLERFTSLGELVTFTRSTGGGRFNAQGQYEWVEANVPRIDYDPATGECLGLLVEEQRTNLLPWSDTFDGFVESTLSPESFPDLRARILGAAAAPDGTMTATKLVVSGTKVTQRMYRSMSTEPGIHTWSLFAKKGELKYIGLRTSSGENPGATFDLEAGVELTDTPGARITPYGDGWHRISIPYDPDINSVIWVILVNPDSPLSIASWQGNGSDGLYIWGGQVEAGEFPTSYIPTDGAAVTRAADSALVDNLSPWYNPTQGAMIASVASGDANPVPRGIVCIESAASTNTSRSFAAVLGVDNSTDFAQNGSYLNPGFASATGNITVGMSGSWEGSTMAQNGLVAATPRTVGSGLDRMWIGAFTNGKTLANMHIKSLTYYPYRLTNTELQELTQ